MQSSDFPITARHRHALNPVRHRAEWVESRSAFVPKRQDADQSWTPAAANAEP